MSLIWPIALILLVLPISAQWLQRKPSGQGALSHPYLTTLSYPAKHSTSSGLWPWPLWIVWILFIIALARPAWIGPPIGLEHSGRNIMLTVDLSESMLERDMVWDNTRVSRYQAMRNVVGEFVAQRQGDFLGLVVFGTFADIQAPLTADLIAVQNTLQDLLPGMAGPSTAIGDGLGLAVQRLRESEAEDKVIILLSDGANRTGNLSPQDAANVAKQSNIRVHTIGFGSEGGFFRVDGVDEPTLRAIADDTGGRFFRATNSEQLEQVFQLLDELEASVMDQPSQRVVKEFFWIPLLVSFALLAIYQGYRSRSTL